MDERQTGATGSAVSSGEPGKQEGYGVDEMGINVGWRERWISAAAGGALLLYGFRRRSWLGTVLALGGGNLLLRGLLGKSLAYRALGINTARARRGAGEPVRVDKALLINRPVEEVYRFWRNLENLPRIMSHLLAVRNIDDKRSHWVARAPAGMEVEWDAEIIRDDENRLIAWRSLEGSEIHTQGQVSFDPSPDGKGTVHVVLEYHPPLGKVGAALAKLFGEEPNQQIEEDLWRLKKMLESGEPAWQGAGG